MLVEKPSVCPLDCPDTCSLSVTVDEGRITRVRGSRANPYTAGAICTKVSTAYPNVLYGPERLTRPLLRTGPRGSGAFAPIGWEEAIDRVHDGIRAAIDRHGPQTVLPLNYAGPHGKLAMESMDRRFFHRLGATLLDRPPLCGGVRGLAYTSVLGGAPGMPPEQAEDADLIVVWSNNVTVSNLHLARVITRARRRGAHLVVVDPRAIKVAEQADLHLAPRPGTDVVLAYALAAELERLGAVDEGFIAQWVAGADAYRAEARRWTVAQAAAICGLEADAIRRAARLWAGSPTVALSIGNGMERGRSGGSGIRAAIALQALTGNFGRRGAGVIAKAGAAFPATPARLQRPDLVPPGTRTINIVDAAASILDDTLDPPIRAVLVYNHNPVGTHPDQRRMIEALSREDVFVAGCDIVMTDSMAFADVVLPAASHFEHADIYAAYGQTWLQRTEPVIPPVGEALPNTEIFRRLARRFGFDDPIFTADDAELMDDAFDPEDPRLQGHRPSALPTDGALGMRTRDGAELILCDTVMPGTGSGRIELYSEALEKAHGCGLPVFDPVPASAPLALVSPSSDRRINTTFGGNPDSAAPEAIEIHPDDAAAAGITDGMPVRVWNARGETRLTARVTTAVRPGVAYSPKGMWRRASATGLTVNALISADIKADIAGGACYNDTWIHVAPA